MNGEEKMYASRKRGDRVGVGGYGGANKNESFGVALLVLKRNKLFHLTGNDSSPSPETPLLSTSFLCLTRVHYNGNL